MKKTKTLMKKLELTKMPGLLLWQFFVFVFVFLLFFFFFKKNFQVCVAKTYSL